MPVVGARVPRSTTYAGNQASPGKLTDLLETRCVASTAATTHYVAGIADAQRFFFSSPHCLKN